MKFNLNESKNEYGLPTDVMVLNSFLEQVDYSNEPSAMVQSVQQFKNSMVGNCWDYTNFAANYLDSRGIDFNTFFVQINDFEDCPTHTFIILNIDDKFYWMENAWLPCEGIHQFDSEEEAVKEVGELFTEKYNPKYEYDYELYQYDTLPLKGGGYAPGEFLEYIYTTGTLLYTNM